MRVLLITDSIEGKRVIGPFHTDKELDDYVDEFCGGVDNWEVFELIKPTY